MQNLEKNLSMYNLISVIKLVFLMTTGEFVSSFNNIDSKFLSVDISLNFESTLGVTDLLEEE